MAMAAWLPGALALTWVLSGDAAIAADLVPSLPGISQLLSRTYSGYLDAPGGKHLHYLFYESQTGNASDPLLLWFNGGPGCSSLEGAFSESGPLWSTTGGVELQVNEYSFNNFSHQLFIESPTCVGFSYNDATGLAACTHSDTSTAEDNLAALLAWFAGFPEYLPNELWITGESYAGIYVPTLAKNVVEHNANGSSPRLNLQGIMVGNGCLGSEVGVCSHTAHGDFLKVKQLAGHGFVSDEAWERALAACPTGDDWTRADAACNVALVEARAEAGLQYDVYDLYAGSYGSCPYGARKGLPPASPADRAAEEAAPPRRPIVPGSPDAALSALGNSCTDTADLRKYLNTAAVQTALHVRPKLWVECSDSTDLLYRSDVKDERESVYPVLQAAGLSILIYNGESDACVPITDNQWWTRSMNYTVARPWHAWTAADGTLGGYVTEYAPPKGKFTFLTVRGSGHMVPSMSPPYAWDFTHRWVKGLPL